MESFLTELQYGKDFLIFLDRENILMELQMCVVEYEENINNSVKNYNFKPAFRFKFKLDLMKIQEISEKLHYLFMKEPEAGRELAKKVIFYALKLISFVKFDKSDLQIVFSVINLPITKTITEMLRYPSYGLESIQGVLIARTTIAKYKRSSMLSCKLLSCPGFKWRRYPENFGNICPNCLSFMEEDVSALDTGEEIICQFIPLKTFPIIGRFQVFKVRIKDELCSAIDLQIGEEYKVIGKFEQRFFEAMNIQQKQLETNSFSNLLQINSSIPVSIANLHRRVSHECPDSPWSFVCAISTLLASDLIPSSSFFHLKSGLMLSLCSQKTRGSPVPLVAIGADSLNAQYLFQKAGKLAERYVNISTAHSYLGGAAKTGFHADSICQEAGQLILAAKGVCNLGNWSKLKKEQANYIFQTIESGQIVMNKGKLEKTNLINFLPLKCAVWTYWCHITTSRNDQLQLKSLVNVFGMPFLAEEKNEFEFSKICLIQLKKGMEKFNSIPANFIPFQDLKEFIDIINSRELILSDSASQLIRNYFVVSRRERPQCLPIGAIQTITSLAEAYARLALRDKVTFDDAVAIIYLYEEAISTLFGESIKPFSKLTWDQEEPIYVFMSKQIYQFKIWLEKYTLT